MKATGISGAGAAAVSRGPTREPEGTQLPGSNDGVLCGCEEIGIEPVEYRTEPSEWLIPVNHVEALLIRANIEMFIAVGLDELGYGIAQFVKVREARTGTNEWVIEFKARMVDAPPKIIEGGVAYSSIEQKIIFAVRKVEAEVSE